MHLLFTNSLIVRLSPGSWLPNWLHGQASTCAVPAANLLADCFRIKKRIARIACLAVRPQ